MKKLLWLALGGSMLFGCSSSVECFASYTEAGGPDSPCVAPPEGEERCFALPQACPSLFPIRFGTVLVGKSYPVNVILSNGGDADLSVTKIASRGDMRGGKCAFVKGQYEPAINTGFRSPKSMVINFVYRPTTAGTDFAAIEITSNAENVPVMAIPVCGRAVTSTVGQNPNEPTTCEDKSKAEYSTCLEEE